MTCLVMEFENCVMSKSDRVVKFVSEIGNTPVTNRRQGFSDRKTSMWRRGVAVGFLLGVASSVALWVYDRWASRLERYDLAAQGPLAQD